MRDNACEYKSDEIMQFLDSKGIRSHFSTPKEQWQNGAVNSIMLIARTVMVESGLGGRFWFRAATAGKDARNVTFKERIGMNGTKPCTVKRKMSLITALSDAELMSTRTSSAEQMESTRQGLRKPYMSVLYRT